MHHAVWNDLSPLDPGVSRRWDALRGGVQGLGDLDRVRAERGAEMARFVSLQVELRRRAAGRLDIDQLAFLTSKGAEQATPAPVARHRAARFAALGGGSIAWDACCGVGSDLVALAERFDRVLATDRSLETLRCAVANIAYATDLDDGPMGPGTALAAAVADAGRPVIAPALEGRVLGLFDPDRRPEGRREGRPERWGPPLRTVLAVANRLAGGCIKLPPGLAVEELAGPTMPRSAAWTWISLDGEMKELCLWTGRLAGGGDDHQRSAPSRKAVALRSSGAEVTYGAVPGALPADVDPAGAERAAWLVELDVALWQAGLAGAFAREHGLAPLAGGGTGGFLVAPEPTAHAMARCWRIAGTAAGDRRRVRALLRAHDIGGLVVKTRNHPETAERLARSYRGSGAREGLLAVTRVGGRAMAFLLARGV